MSSFSQPKGLVHSSDLSLFAQLSSCQRGYPALCSAGTIVHCPCTPYMLTEKYAFRWTQISTMEETEGGSFKRDDFD